MKFTSPHAIHKSNLHCNPSAKFRGSVAVTCRIFETMDDAFRAIPISTWVLLTHGTQVHFGDPSKIGIKDILNETWKL